MSKSSALPADRVEAIELLTRALREGHAVTLSLATPPHVVRTAPTVMACGLRFGLTPSQARVLVALLEEHGTVDKTDLHRAMSDGRITSKKIKTVDTVVHHVREALKSHGVRIETCWGSGYRLDKDARDKLRKLLASAASENAKTET